ncbi:MAG: heavy-metal-associated domain-containing protein [Oscillospiraceae bacterium]|nr:heavy-metal-associated domain-containing protein [Oscillospiraceae bacterium]
MHDSSHDHKRSHSSAPALTVEQEPSPAPADAPQHVVLTVEGMMCAHCEARVKAALEGVDGVLSAAADHESGVATAETAGAVDADALRAAVEAQDYKVLDVRTEETTKEKLA